jgi:hypothetical protein
MPPRPVTGIALAFTYLQVGTVTNPGFIVCLMSCVFCYVNFMTLEHVHESVAILRPDVMVKQFSFTYISQTRSGGLSTLITKVKTGIF